MQSFHYRFKQVLQEELARLETLRLPLTEHSLASLRSFDYAPRLRRRTLVPHGARKSSLVTFMNFLSLR